MEISGKAYFVSDPRRIEDLTVLHLVEKERPFEVVKIVKLARPGSGLGSRSVHGYGRGSAVH